ncbi:MAG: hypothetical protein ACYC3I_00485 [Gemmataceae bacterium]
MPKELFFEELEPAEALSESIEKVHDDLRRGIYKIGRILEGMKGTALAFENAWRKIVTNVARGQTAEMQAERTGLLNEFEKRLGILKKGYALLTREKKEGWTDLDPDFLLPEIASMERLKARVFDLWQSADDLEDLSARDYPLTTADLDQIGAQRRPPDSWYAEESKPF